MKAKRGRPSKEENQVRVMMMLPKELLEKIDNFSNQYGLPRSTFIKMAIVEKMLMLEKGASISSEK